MTIGYIGVPTTTDPAVLSTDALNYLMANIPGYAPSDGNLEVWLVMALAQMLATSRDVASIVPDEIFEYFGTTIANLPPIAAQPSTVLATITVQDAMGYTIPAGVQVAFQVTGNTIALFKTANVTIIAPGYTTATNVALTAETAEYANNGLTGTMVLIDPVVYITGVVATSVSSGGLDAETSGAYLSRLVAELTLLAPRPILPGDFGILAESIAGVYRALGVDGYNASRQFTDGVLVIATNVISSATANFVSADVGRGVSDNAGAIPGGTTIASVINLTTATLSVNATANATGDIVTLAAMTGQARTVGVSAVDATGTVVSGTIQAALITYLQAKREVNFVVSFITPTITAVNVAFTIHCTVGANTSNVVASVTAAIQDYLSQAVWGGGANNPPTWDPAANTVRYLSVAAVIESVTGVSYLASLTLNGSAVDVVLPGVAPLATYGTIAGTAV